MRAFGSYRLVALVVGLASCGGSSAPWSYVATDGTVFREENWHTAGEEAGKRSAARDLGCDEAAITVRVIVGRPDLVIADGCSWRAVYVAAGGQLVMTNRFALGAPPARDGTGPAALVYDTPPAQNPPPVQDAPSAHDAPPAHDTPLVHAALPALNVPPVRDTTPVHGTVTSTGGVLGAWSKAVSFCSSGVSMVAAVGTITSVSLGNVSTGVRLSTSAINGKVSRVSVMNFEPFREVELRPEACARFEVQQHPMPDGAFGADVELDCKTDDGARVVASVYAASCR
jgi:hypothetical protein